MKEVNPSVFRRFPFRPKTRSSSLLQGSFPSNRIGQGQEFYSLRPYQFGDEARKISWKRYAQTGELSVKEDIAESNARIWVALDLSASMEFGGKPDLIRGFSAFVEDLLREGNNSAGCIGFSDEIHLLHRPRMGFSAIRSVYDLLRQMKAKEKRIMNINLARDVIVKHARRGDVAFLISDFISSQNLKNPLSALASDLEFIPVIVRDPRENTDNWLGRARISFRDMETDRMIAPSEIARLNEYDDRLKKLFSSLFLDFLWLEGAYYNDAITCVVQWLSERNRVR